MKNKKTDNASVGCKASIPKPAKGTPHPQKMAYAPYTYDHIMGCIDRVQNIIRDLHCGISKDSARVLTDNALRTIGIVRSAFQHSQAELKNIEFKVFVTEPF